jgi:hypothetical protein
MRRQDRSHHKIRVLGLVVLGCARAACNHMVLDPAPIVPTTQPVSYSARIELAEVVRTTIESQSIKRSA